MEKPGDRLAGWLAGGIFREHSLRADQLRPSTLPANCLSHPRVSQVSTLVRRTAKRLTVCSNTTQVSWIL
jgi:DNA-directed RNA polymerase alpha subunit